MVFDTQSFEEMIPEFQGSWSFSSPRSQVLSLVGLWTHCSLSLGFPFLPCSLTHSAVTQSFPLWGQGCLSPPRPVSSTKHSAWTRWAISSCPLKGHRRGRGPQEGHVTPGCIPGGSEACSISETATCYFTSPYFPDVETEAEKSWNGSTSLPGCDTFPGWWWWRVLRRTWGKALGKLLQSREGKWGLLLPELKPSGSGQATLNSIKTNTDGAMEWRSGEEVSSPSLELCRLWQSSPVEGVLWREYVLWEGAQRFGGVRSWSHGSSSYF